MYSKVQTTIETMISTLSFQSLNSIQVFAFTP